MHIIFTRVYRTIFHAYGFFTNLCIREAFRSIRLHEFDRNGLTSEGYEGFRSLKLHVASVKQLAQRKLPEQSHCDCDKKMQHCWARSARLG